VVAWHSRTALVSQSAPIHMYSRTGYPIKLGTNLVPPRVPPKLRYSPLNSWRKAPRRARPRRCGNIDAPAVLLPTLAEHTQVRGPIMWDCVCGAFQPFLSRSWGKPEFSSIWVEKGLRNGSETARDTTEFWPSSRPALLLARCGYQSWGFHCH
jgi:hypothetical protein